MLRSVCRHRAHCAKHEGRPGRAHRPAAVCRASSMYTLKSSAPSRSLVPASRRHRPTRPGAAPIRHPRRSHQNRDALNRRRRALLGQRRAPQQQEQQQQQHSPGPHEGPFRLDTAENNEEAWTKVDTVGRRKRRFIQTAQRRREGRRGGNTNEPRNTTEARKASIMIVPIHSQPRIRPLNPFNRARLTVCGLCSLSSFRRARDR